MKRKGKHGGARRGAGRKSILSKIDRLLIGARCETEWTKPKRPEDGLENSWGVLNALSLNDRKVILQRLAEAEDALKNAKGRRPADQLKPKTDDLSAK